MYRVHMSNATMWDDDFLIVSMCELCIFFDVFWITNYAFKLLIISISLAHTHVLIHRRDQPFHTNVYSLANKIENMCAKTIHMLQNEAMNKRQTHTYVCYTQTHTELSFHRNKSDPAIVGCISWYKYARFIPLLRYNTRMPCATELSVCFFIFGI